MFPAKTRHAARITAAAVGGVFAASLALPGGALAQTMYQADDNGVLAYSTSANNGERTVHTIFTDGTHDAVVSVLDPDPNPQTSVHPEIKGVPNEWSVDGSRLLISDTNGDLQDVKPWTGQHVKQIDEPFSIVRGSMSPDGKSYAYGSTSDGARLLKDGDSASTSLFAGASDGTAWSNTDHLLVTFDEVGLYRFHDPVTSTGDNNSIQTDAAVYPLNATISRDGAWVAYNSLGLDDQGSNWDVVVSKADGTAPPFIPETGRPLNSTETFAAMSPDGKKVAFVSDRLGGGQWAIYILDIATGLATEVPNTRISGGPTYQGLSWQPADVPYLAEGSITTAPEIGNTLKQDMQQDIPTGPVFTTWQWQRCTNVVGTPNNYTSGDCVDMNGETGEGYALLQGDVGAQFRVIRTVTNGAGTDTQASEITEPAYVPAPPDTTPPGVPTITTKPNAKSNATSPTFAWTGAEPGGTYECSLDNAAFTACTSGSTFPVTGDGPHSFRVKQLDAANNPGDPAEHTWTLDTTKPSTPTIGSRPTGTTQSTTAQITFTGDETGGSFECREGSDAATWNACTSPADLSGLTEGAKRFSVRQLDEAGNASDPEIVTWTVDTTGPNAPTFTTTPGTRSNATAPTFAWTGAEGGGTYECSLDGAAFTACTSGSTVAVSGETAHTLRVRQIDAAGNEGTPAEHTWTLDTTKPAAPTFGDTPGPRSNATSPTFTWTGAEGGGTYRCALDGAAYAPCTSGTPVPVTGDGPHTFRVKQLDAAGNEGDVAEHTWTLDTTAPGTPDVTAKPDATTKSKAATIAFTGAEAGGTFECRLDLGTWAACTSPHTLTELADGDKSLSIRQVDAAGNHSTTPAHVQWTVDTNPPAKPVLTTDLGLVTTREVQVQFTGEGGGTFECQLDAGAWKACGSPHTLKDYVSGDHTFRVREIDAAGNVGPEETDDFSADVNGPAKPTFTKTPATSVNTQKVVFEFTGADPNGTGFECELEELPGWNPCVSGMDVDGLPEGTYTLAVRQLGQNGNAGESAKFTWTYDKTGPAEPGVTGAPSGETTATSIDVSVTVEDGAKLECDLDGNGWEECSSPVKVGGFGVGPHTLKLRQTDKAGNHGEVRTISWTVVAPKADEPEAPETPVTPEPKPEPKPQTPATPQTPAVVQTPAVETPAAKAATPDTTPKASPKTETTPAKPKLTALIGGAATGNDNAAGGKGTGNGTSSAATITVKKDGVGVGCAITGTVLTSCKVDLYADVATGATARAAAVNRVLVGTGTYRKADGSSKMEVDVTLNATGRELLRKSPEGLKVSVAITGQPVKGEPLKAEGVATLVRQRTSAVVGGFAVNSAQLTPAAKRQLVKLAKQVKGTAVAIRVVGHTDGSTTDADYLKGLGKRRARTVAAFLRAHGVKAKATLVSRGATKPLASNASKAGRAKNRRVELRIDR